MVKRVLGTSLLVLGVICPVALAFAQRVPLPRGEIRVVDDSPNQWAYMTFNIFEHLLEIDRDGNLVPGLATGWRWLDDRTLEVSLRKGVKFHDGSPFDAEIAKLNIEETGQLRHPFHLGNFLSFDPGTRVEIVDRYTIRVLMPKPDGAALSRLSYIHIGSRAFYQAGGWGSKHW